MILSILADQNSVVVYTVSVLSQIFSSLRPFSRHFGIVPRAPPIIGITVPFMLILSASYA